MKTVRNTSLAVALAGSLVALTALAQDNAARGAAQGAKPEAYTKASTIIGMNAHSPQNENLGDISDLVIDCKAQRVVYAALGVGGVVTANKYIALPWDALSMNEGQKYFTLNMTKADIDRMPGFTKDNWPQEAAALGGTTGTARDTARDIKEGVRDTARGARDTMMGKHLWRANGLIGMTVRSPRGEDLGRIGDLAIMLKDGKVLYAALNYGGGGGVGGKHFAVPLRALEMNNMSLKPNDAVFVLNVDKAQLDQGTGFDRNNWPAQADTSLFAGAGR